MAKKSSNYMYNNIKSYMIFELKLPFTINYSNLYFQRH